MASRAKLHTKNDEMINNNNLISFIFLFQHIKIFFRNGNKNSLKRNAKVSWQYKRLSLRFRRPSKLLRISIKLFVLNERQRFLFSLSIQFFLLFVFISQTISSTIFKLLKTFLKRREKKSYEQISEPRCSSFP